MPAKGHNGEVNAATSGRARQPEERSAIIDLAAVRHNVGRLLRCARGRELIAVVKADGYGHGAEEVARAALAAGAGMLGTAHVTEALALRRCGITAPVLAWLHTPSTDFRAAVRYGICLGISGWELDAVLDAARAHGAPATLHLKIDTGLGRNGATVTQWPALVERVAAAQREGLVDVTGIFTHLAVADEPDRAGDTVAQLGALTRAVDTARGAGLRPRTIHAANTPALLAAEQYGDPDDVLRDAVRVGLGLYGLSPFPAGGPEDPGLIPAMTLRARVANVKSVPSGQGVSYGLTYHTDRPTRLALIPLGYGDGVPRAATGAPVFIGGRVYPVVGRIAMDQCVVDLSLGRPAGHDAAGPAEGAGVPDATAQPLVRIGDEAVLFGAGRYPSATAWAEASGSINYEVVTRISPRVPREYVTGTENPADSDSDADADADAGDADSGARPRWTLTRHPVTPEQTRRLAQRLAGFLGAGDLLMLNGDLGAGKTTFTQGLGRGLGVREGIISPTFVLSRRHPNLPEGPRPGGPDLVHVDAYRLDSAGEIDDIDLEDTVDTCVTVVEWGTGKVEHLSGSRLVIDIERPRGPAGAPSGDPSDVARVLAELAAAWEDEEEQAGQPRTVTLRGYGPRWADRPEL